MFLQFYCYDKSRAKIVMYKKKYNENILRRVIINYFDPRVIDIDDILPVFQNSF